MHEKLTELLDQIEGSNSINEIKETAKELIVLSANYHMVDILSSDAVLSFKEHHKRTPTKAEEDAVSFGFKCGVSY